jgi:hypothetical protein
MQSNNTYHSLINDIEVPEKERQYEGEVVEAIDESDPDYQFILQARARRKEGEKCYSLNEIIQEFGQRPQVEERKI